MAGLVSRGDRWRVVSRRFGGGRSRLKTGLLASEMPRGFPGEGGVRDGRGDYRPAGVNAVGEGYDGRCASAESGRFAAEFLDAAVRGPMFQGGVLALVWRG